MASTHLHAEPIQVLLDGAALADLARRLRAARMPTATSGTWERGMPGGWLAELIADWQAFDPQPLQARLDQLAHLQVEIGGVVVHVVHVPGFGFSGPPPAGGLTHEQVAELWYRIMADALGYRRFVAHGSDLGAGVTARLARAHPDAVVAIHLATPGLAAPPQPWSDAVREHFDQVEAWSAEEGGYAHMHATKPATIGAALDDSPVALAAWVGEKLTRWSSTTADGQPAFDRDRLLSTLTLYWTTRTASSSLLPYWAHRHTPASALPPDDPPPTPTAIDIFGGEIVPFPKPPRELAERYFNVVNWAEHDRGGHFPAVAKPRLLADRLRAAFRPCRRP